MGLQAEKQATLGAKLLKKLVKILVDNPYKYAIIRYKLNKEPNYA
jgi:hypothetical protein